MELRSTKDWKDFTGSPVFFAQSLSGRSQVQSISVDFRKEPYVDDLVSFFENIEGIDVAAIRSKDYGAKPKIAVSRFDDSAVTTSLLALCERVSKS